MASPISSFGPWGGAGGSRWSYQPIGDGNGIAKIVLRFDTNTPSNIKSISFRDAQGQTSGVFGGTDDIDLGLQTEVDFSWPGEYLTTLSGSYGVVKDVTVITSLAFTTNKTTYGPFGATGTTPFSGPTAGNVVVGFFGACGYYLDSLGIITSTLVPLPITSYGPSGGDGGDPFTYKTRNPIVQIVLRVGTLNIKSISFKDSQGQTSGVFGGNGDNDIGDKKEANLQSGEYFITIGGSYAAFNGLIVITSLKFTTNLATYEFGYDGRTTFSYPVGDNTVAGFFGSCGYDLDSIGVYLTPSE